MNFGGNTNIQTIAGHLFHFLLKKFSSALMTPCNLIPGRGGPGIRSFGPLEVQSEEDNRVKKETMRGKLDFILRYS